MRSATREFVTLSGLAAAFYVAFLIQPDWALTEAHRLCEGEPIRVFDSMNTCDIGQRPGCTCFRPDNPWASVFWFAVLPLIGISASILLRSRFLFGAVLLSAVLAAAGALVVLGHRGSMDEEGVTVGLLVIAAYVSLVLAAFGVCRAVKYWFVARRPETNKSLERTREG
jgi:hypothetical protein